MYVSATALITSCPPPLQLSYTFKLVFFNTPSFNFQLPHVEVA